MSMQRRLALSFLFIMSLFAINQVVYLFGNGKRSEVVEYRRRALNRRIQILAIEQEVGKLQRNVELQSQIAPGAAQGGFRKAEISGISEEIDAVSHDIDLLKNLSDDSTRSQIVDLEKTFKQLSASWLVFYRNAGVNQTVAITEVVTRAEPLSEELLKLLPLLKEAERERAEEAGRRFSDVNRVTTQITSCLFLFSALLASVIAYQLSRHITTGLNVLERGADLLGAGMLEQHIPVRSHDELGHLAQTFNHMADSLLATQTRLRQTNEELEAARLQSDAANTAKSTFLANMSHELRTPLNAIIGFSEVLADKTFGELNKRQERYVSNVLTSGRHLLQLINDILDLAKVEAGRMDLDLAEIDVAEAIRVVETVSKPLALKKQQTLSVHILPGLPPILADPSKFKQIMYNLLSNAVKYTPDGGIIHVTAAIIDDTSRREVSSVPEEPVSEPEMVLRISIADSGVGIKEEDLDRVFGEFEQLDDSYARQQQGTGLGLALTRRFVAMHGGRLWVESDGTGKGSTFHFTLPLQLDDPRPEATTTTPESDQSKLISNTGNPTSVESAARRTVLVVEDDPKARELLSYYLSEGGYEVETAATAGDAVRLARERNIYAITLDLVLQNEDGWQVLDQLKADPVTKNIPVVIVSITEDRQLGVAFGASDFLVKPVDRTELVKAVEKAGASQRASSVLVIDDQPETVDLLSDVLRVRGFGVLQAYDGQQGIDIAIARMPDVIVLDLMMPGITGFDVVQRLREHPEARQIPILVFTAKELTREDRELLSSHVRAVISKSGKDDLLRELEKQRVLIGIHT